LRKLVKEVCNSKAFATAKRLQQQRVCNSKAFATKLTLTSASSAFLTATADSIAIPNTMNSKAKGKLALKKVRMLVRMLVRM
jgi:hypothetical protein